jgi:hypothetical protein
VRKARSISAQTPKRYGNPKLHDVTLPSAKQLGYHSAQQRQRWQICVAVPDITVDHLKDKILSSSEGILTRASLISAGKQHLREEEADALAALEDSCTVEDINTLIDTGKKFGVIYADPPWTFKVYSGKGKSRSADRLTRLIKQPARAP